MSRFLEDFGLNQDIMKTIQPHTLICICCLERNVPIISLITCSHSDFLNNFEKPEINPLNQVICHRCHNMLKKIKQFKLQVEDSFKILEAQANNPESISHRQSNLKFHKIIDINIPETDPNQDEQTNPETQNSFENITCTTENNLENIIKEENNFENIINKENSFQNIINEENSFENITCTTENNLENIIKEENNFKNITRNTNNSLDNIIKEENDFENIIKEQNNLENITCEEDNSFVNIVKEENNFECTDTKIQYTTPINKINENTNTKIAENTYLNKKFKNIETALSIINKNEGNDAISFLGTSLQNIVSSHLTSILQATGIPNVFDLVTKRMDDVEDDPMQVIDDMETDDAANTSYTSDIKVTTLTKKELMLERKLIAKSKAYLDLPHRCDCCLMGFQFKDNLDDHTTRRHTAKPGGVTCSICQQELPRAEYDEHRSRHYTRYCCGNCEKQFSLYDEAVEHYEVKHTTTIHNCQQYNSTRLSQAAESPAGKKVKWTDLKVHKCTDCNKEFSRYINLEKHKRTHNTRTIPPIENICVDCGKKFMSRYKLEKHSAVHKKIKGKTLLLKSAVNITR